ncbi:DUF4235 domain-containing protein [Streptosporangium sp. NPDC048047]|uniref:DUF4235 domain-containing protein n=1 Tax=unclassified Streptosporangium TaxID=2632669 RepID=UPI00343F348A
MSKIVSKGTGAVTGMVGGVVAGAIFKQVWKFASGKDEAPDPTSDQYAWKEILVAAAIQGAIFGVVKAVLDRTTTGKIHRATGR